MVRGRGVGDGPVLLGVHVDPRVREVRQSSRVVPVQVGEDDVPHVLWRVPEADDLAQRALRRVQRGLGVGDPVRAQRPVGLSQVGGAEAGVDQDRAVRVRLDEQAVADDGQFAMRGVRHGRSAERRDRAEGTAVEMMDAHKDPLEVHGRAVRNGR